MQETHCPTVQTESVCVRDREREREGLDRQGSVSLLPMGHISQDHFRIVLLSHHVVCHVGIANTIPKKTGGNRLITSSYVL